MQIAEKNNTVTSTRLRPNSGIMMGFGTNLLKYWVLDEQIIHLHEPLGLQHPVPLQVHASYTREEILTIFGASTVLKPMPLQSGVHRHDPTKTDLLFITLQE